jgi:hypothetical protein
LPSNLNSLVAWQTPNAPEQRRQVLTVNELHRDEMHSVDFTDVIHATNIWVGYLAGDAHLVVETREHPYIKRNRFWQEFQRDRLIELEVFGFVDLAHPAAAKQADDSISIREHRARNESPAAT